MVGGCWVRDRYEEEVEVGYVFVFADVVGGCGGDNLWVLGCGSDSVAVGRFLVRR